MCASLHQVVRPPAPAVALTSPTAFNVTIGQPVQLSAAGSNCTAAPCAYTFTLACSNKPLVTKRGAAATANFSTGPGAQVDVQSPLTASLPCNATVEIANAYNTPATTAQSVQVHTCS